VDLGRGSVRGSAAPSRARPGPGLARVRTRDPRCRAVTATVPASGSGRAGRALPAGAHCRHGLICKITISAFQVLDKRTLASIYFKFLGGSCGSSTGSLDLRSSAIRGRCMVRAKRSRVSAEAG
jgi:hypothetical protein